jgi:hypothetical protein
MCVGSLSDIALWCVTPPTFTLMMTLSIICWSCEGVDQNVVFILADHEMCIEEDCMKIRVQLYITINKHLFI